MEKSFKDKLSPSMNFITTPKSSKEIPKGYKPNPEYIETKSKRVQLLIKPSTHEKLKSIAIEKNISVNELINNILESHIS